VNVIFVEPRLRSKSLRVCYINDNSRPTV